MQSNAMQFMRLSQIWILLDTLNKSKTKKVLVREISFKIKLPQREVRLALSSLDEIQNINAYKEFFANLSCTKFKRKRKRKPLADCKTCKAEKENCREKLKK
ncbi:uncharacterized protein LOC119677409 [Teleopsis dalmanni]|uniref:uncharacterized protein LOC119677409 n=1 Tax=Teleopsis dalmanni TaxID=139649 RepID=UPI0018CEF12C|nr:uncharacterized protein LOC119677409 [Teleopsis dalmanni]